MEKINYKKASTFYLVGTLFNKGIAFITVPIFTRILSVSDYGIVTTYNSWTSIMIMLMSLALYMAVRSSFIDYKDNVNDFLSVILVFNLIYGMILIGIVLLVSFLIKSDLEYLLIVCCLIQSLSSAIIESVSMYFMMTYKYKARTAIMVFPNMISTVIAVFVIRNLLTDKLYLGRVIPNAIVTLLFGIVVFIYGKSRSNVNFNKEYLDYGLKISLPLVIHGIALSILSQSDRTMITFMRSSNETGIYGLIYNFSMIATVITTSFDGIWIPYFTRKMKEEKYQDINKVAIKYIELMTAAIISIVLVGPEIVKILATDAYWEGIKIIPPIVLANYLIFLYTLYVNIEHYYKKTVFISLNTLIAAASNIVLNLFFISKWGYVGAAYTTLMSYIISLILHYKYARKLNMVLFPIKLFAVPICMIIIAIFIFYVFLNVFFVRWGCVITFLIFLIYKERFFIKETLNR